LLQRGTAKIHRLNKLQSDSFNRVAYIFMAELRGLFSWHGRAYSGKVKFSRARVCGSDEKSFGEEEVRNLGFIPVGGERFYSCPGAAAFVQCVEEAAADRALPSAPPSCFCPEVEDDRSGIRLGCGARVLGRFDGLRPSGLRLGK
jgi:hypothetical protein